MIKNIKWLLIASISIVACNKDEDPVAVVAPEVPVSANGLDLTRYVALGNSLSAGFSDSALFKQGQMGSYTKLMADQFALVGGGVFKIPMMNDDRGGLLIGGAQYPITPDPTAPVANPILPPFSPRLTNAGIVNNPPAVINSPNITLAAAPGSQTTETANNIFATKGPFNNMGVPGAKSFHLLAPGYGSLANLSLGLANPYFVRMSSNPTSTTVTVLGDAMAQAPTFFSLWIGNNDVLGNALAGGVPTSIDPRGDNITPQATFTAVYTNIVNTLVGTNTKGVIANIPYVTSIPNFTTVPFNPLTASSLGLGIPANGVATIRTLNTNLYGPLSAALALAGESSRIKRLSETSANPLLIFDRSLVSKATEISTNLQSLGFPAATAGAFGAIYGQVRQTTKDDLVLLGTQSVISKANPLTPAPLAAQGLNRFGVTSPLRDKDILTVTEIADLRTAVDGYNVTIKGLAESKGLAFVDTNLILQNVSRGLPIGGGYTISSSYVVGGAFSYDGVHPSPRGYALLANEFLKSINAKYGSTFRMYDLTKFPIQIPKVLP
jgi:hypothetical protein